MYLKFLFLSLLATVSTVVYAQAPADTTVELPPAVVESERAAGALTSPLRLTVIGPDELESLPVRDVADALDRRSNVHVVRYGPTGLSTASIRGLGARHTAVFLDGVLLSDPQSNQIDLAVIPAVMLESIEITHGPSSAAKGGGSLGGTVALSTLRAADEGRVRLGLEAGEYGRRRIGLVGAGRSGAFSITAAGEINRYTGDYLYRNPTLITPVEQTRVGADRESETLYANAGYDAGRHRVSASVWINSVERGLPGPANASPSNARQWDDHVRMWVSSEHHFDSWKASIDAVGHETRLRYVNATSASDELTKTRTADLQGRLRRVFGSHLVGTLGIQSIFDRTDAAAEDRFAGFAEAMFETERWLILPSARFEIQTTEMDSWTSFIPRLGANLRLSEQGEIHLKLNAGRAYRSPSFLERYWQPGGNPNLKPESGWSFDLGMLAQVGPDKHVRIEIGGFYTDLRDQIVWFPSLVASGLQVWRPLNVGRAITYGTEASLETSFILAGVQMDMGGSATLSRAIDRSNEDAPSYGKQLRYTPELSTSLYAAAELARFSFDASARYVGARFITSDESMRLDGYFVVDTQVSYRLPVDSTELLWAIQIENVLNTDYSVVRFYPMPPRSISLRFGVEL